MPCVLALRAIKRGKRIDHYFLFPDYKYPFGYNQFLHDMPGFGGSHDQLQGGLFTDFIENTVYKLSRVMPATRSLSKVDVSSGNLLIAAVNWKLEFRAFSALAAGQENP